MTGNRWAFIQLSGALLLAASLMALNAGPVGAQALSEARKNQLTQQALAGHYQEVAPFLLPRATRGDPEIQYLLGVAYEKGKRYEEAMRWFQRAADQGHQDALFSVAYLVEKGLGVTRDPAQAFRRYLRAAETGMPEAQLKVGMLYEAGQGVEKNPQQAAQWYRKAADQGFALAQYAYGALAQAGSGMAANAAEAFRYFKQAADRGLAIAQLRASVMLESGEGVTKSIQDSVRYAQKAAAQGYDEAQLKLGLMYEEGLDGGAPQYEDAAKWYRKAAEQGNDYAQMALGTFYLLGQGVDQDYVQGYAWLDVASRNGNAEAESWLKTIVRDMSAKQIAAAQRRAIAWRKPAPQGLK
ncbi:MAG: SEL1-like repeat protein [Vampirovibrionales bacterium]|nr:SEL1-like repeat protein [Vampirovibrionales bacterium]